MMHELDGPLHALKENGCQDLRFPSLVQADTRNQERHSKSLPGRGGWPGLKARSTTRAMHHANDPNIKEGRRRKSDRLHTKSVVVAEGDWWTSEGISFLRPCLKPALEHRRLVNTEEES